MPASLLKLKLPHFSAFSLSRGAQVSGAVELPWAYIAKQAKSGCRAQVMEGECRGRQRRVSWRLEPSGEGAMEMILRNYERALGYYPAVTFC